MDQKPNQEMGTIPGPIGLPLLGNLPQLLPNPLPQIRRLHRRFGNIFYAGFARNSRSVFLLGPEATKLALIDESASFSNRLGYLGQSNFIGKKAILFRDGEDHLALRQAMNGAFRPAALDRYLPAMNVHVDEQLSAFSLSGSRTNVGAEIRLMSLNIAAEVIAGARLDTDASLINENFVNMLKGMVSIGPRLPGTRAWKGARSREFLDRYFRVQIADRRLASSSDLFTKICQIADGMGLDEDDVIDNMLGVLVASYETTATTISMMLYLLAKHPEWQERLHTEVIARRTEPNSFDRNELEELVEMEWALKETLRLYTPLSYFPRRTLRDVEIEGHIIPSNTAVTIAPAFTHQIESIFAKPDRFDPTRFSPSRAEDRVHVCAWMPFGKGEHTCMGMHFARLEIKAFFAKLLRQFRFELTNQAPPSLRYVPVLRPISPLPIHFEPR